MKFQTLFQNQKHFDHMNVGIYRFADEDLPMSYLKNPENTMIPTVKSSKYAIPKTLLHNINYVKIINYPMHSFVHH